MSQLLAKLVAADKRSNLSREKILALGPKKTYDDGRTKQCHKDECDINKIMARFDATGTISHLSKFEGVYADFSDFNFHEQITKLARGETIFNDLSAEVRREFNQDPDAFFAYVNDPANVKNLRKLIPGLAEPGTQLPQVASPTADHEAAVAAASEPQASVTTTTTVVKTEPAPASAEEPT